MPTPDSEAPALRAPASISAPIAALHGAPNRTMHWIGCLLLVGCGGAAEPDSSQAEPRPDVALVLIDTLRRDHLDLYGYSLPTAPYLRELAATSAVFERAYSTSSWTAPATASVLTGLYPPRHGLTLGMHAEDNVREGDGGEAASLSLSKLPDALATLPELFRAAGYQTHAVASNINVSRERGFDRGFDQFQLAPEADAALLRETLEGWSVQRETERPAFWYLHFNDVHKPYEARPPWPPLEGAGRDQGLARYDSEIAYLDGVLATLRERLAWDEDTVILILADHGEEFGDHGSRGHRYRLYGELMNVPLLMHIPGVTDAGLRLDTPVSLIDVLPTLTEIAGLEDGAPRDGLSLLPLIRGEEAAPRPLFAQRRKPNYDPLLWAVVDDGWKLIYSEGEDRSELFDAIGDPLDQHDLAAQHPEQVERLMTLLKPIRAVQPLAAEQGSMELDRDLTEHLRELGYAGDEDD